MNNLIENLVQEEIDFIPDYEKIKGRINTSKHIKKIESGNRIAFAWKKWLTAALSIIIIPLAIVLVLQPWNNADNPNGGKNPFSSTGIYYDQNAVAVAAVKTMDSSKASPMSATVFSETIYPLNKISLMSGIYVGEVSEEGHIKVTYPFTGVRIDQAYEFYVTVPNKTNDFVTMNCGDGTLRVIVANFTLFDGIWPALSDEVILVVIGEKGMLHCLGGGGPYDVQYSMHKYLNGANVEKDTKYEGYGFCIDIYKKEKDWYPTELNLKVVDKDNGTKTYRYIEESYAITEGGTLYDITEICLPFIDVTVITAPEENELITKRLLVSYQTIDENDNSIEQQLIIVLTGDTKFEGTTMNGLVSGKNIRIEFKDNFIVTDTEWMLVAIRIIELD